MKKNSIRKILVPIDFSEHARRAMEFACDMAGRYDNAEVGLLHVYQNPTLYYPDGFVVMTPSLQEELLISVGNELTRLKKEASAALGREVSATVLEGPPGREIVEHARKSGNDFIVMGTHGRTGLAHVFLGSVAEFVVRHAACPVTVIRAAT